MPSNSFPADAANTAGLCNPSEQLNTDTNSVRIGRVLMCSLMLLVLFFQIDHDFSFAGKQIGDIKEEAIKNEFVKEIQTGDTVRKLFLLLFASFGFLATMNAKEKVYNPRRAAMVLFLMLFIWAAGSFFWSEVPGLTLKRLVVATCVTLGAIGLARALRPSEYLLTALITLTCFVTMSLMADLSAGGQPWSNSHRFAGSLHPNNQAFYCGTLCLAAYCMPSSIKTRWLLRGLTLYGAMALYSTLSRTSFLAMLIGISMIFFLQLSQRIRWISLLGFLSVISLGMIVYNGISVGDRASLIDSLLMGRSEQATTLTGRTPLWEELATFSARRPIIGYGYEAFWSPDHIAAISKSQQWTMQSAHNAYFEVVLQLGFVGLFLVVAIAITTINLAQKAYERTRDPGYVFIYGVIFFASANSMLESHAVKFKYPSTIILIGIAMLFLYFPKENLDEPSHEPSNRPMDS